VLYELELQRYVCLLLLLNIILCSYVSCHWGFLGVSVLHFCCWRFIMYTFRFQTVIRFNKRNCWIL